MIAAEKKIDTKTRILDSAERQFADHGFEAASLRSIIADAKVNLAAIHYHYHSKEALLDAVIQRRAGPINAERLRLLDEMERSACAASPSLESVLDAFVGPPFRAGVNPENKTFVRLIGRVMGDNTAIFQGVLERNFRSVIERFMPALIAVVPELSEDEVLWRLNFTGGAMAHSLRSWGQDSPSMFRWLKSPTADEMIARLVSFAAAGFRAPSYVGERHV